MNINAGFIPADHWTQDPKVGGGRLIGEACHFIDLSRFFAGSKITSITCKGMKNSGMVDENISLILQFHMFKEFLSRIEQNLKPLIPYDEIIEISEATIKARKLLV